MVRKGISHLRKKGDTHSNPLPLSASLKSLPLLAPLTFFHLHRPSMQMPQQPLILPRNEAQLAARLDRLPQRLRFEQPTHRNRQVKRNRKRFYSTCGAGGSSTEEDVALTDHKSKKRKAGGVKPANQLDKILADADANDDDDDGDGDGNQSEGASRVHKKVRRGEISVSNINAITGERSAKKKANVLIAAQTKEAAGAGASFGGGAVVGACDMLKQHNNGSENKIWNPKMV